MSNEAQMSMMFYSGFTPDEERKLQQIEHGVIAHVLNTHGNVRPIWQCTSSKGLRLIQLRVPTAEPPVVWQATEDELTVMTGDAVLAAVRK